MAMVCTIDAAGIRAPTYEEVLSDLKAAYQAIYGADVYLEPDSQDGQFLGIFAQALHDTNSMAVAVYNQFSPVSAQGVGLSSVVKVNGIARLVSSASTASLLITGTALETTITNGVAEDANGYRWSLPASVTIPASASITVTATCQTLGAIQAPANTITKIATPTRGWQSVTNPAAASPGAAVETDAALRVRQQRSVAIPSLSVLEGVVGAVANIAGVTQIAALENDTNSTSSDGLPAHSIALVVQGGDTTTIGRTIATKKGTGVYTYGTTTVSVAYTYGGSQTIRFFRPTSKAVAVSVTIADLPGYSSDIGLQIRQAVADYITALGIGEDVLIPRLYIPAQLRGGTGSETFELQSILIAFKPGTPGSSDLVVAFNETATCDVADVSLTVT